MRYLKREPLRKARCHIPALVLTAMLPVLLCALVAPYFTAQEMSVVRVAHVSAAAKNFCLPATNLEKPKHLLPSHAARDLAPSPIDEARRCGSRRPNVLPGLDDAPTLPSLLVYTQTTSSSL